MLTLYTTFLISYLLLNSYRHKVIILTIAKEFLRDQINTSYFINCVAKSRARKWQKNWRVSKLYLGYRKHFLRIRNLFYLVFILQNCIKNVVLFQAQQAGQSKDNEEKKKSSPAEVPRITPHVDLPPQVLQVRNNQYNTSVKDKLKTR